MIKTTYNPNEDAYRLAELNYIKAHSASEEDQQILSNVLRHYAIIEKNTGQIDSTLENILEKARACKDSDFGKYVQECASIVRKVREQIAAEQNNNNNKKSDFMKHYKLVNKIGSGNELD